jgi:hypothetical protein
MTSLTTSSGPGALPLPRRLQQSNATRSSRWLSSHSLPLLAAGWHQYAFGNDPVLPAAPRGSFCGRYSPVLAPPRCFQFWLVVLAHRVHHRLSVGGWLPCHRVNDSSQPLIPFVDARTAHVPVCHLGPGGHCIPVLLRAPLLIEPVVCVVKLLYLCMKAGEQPGCLLSYLQVCPLLQLFPVLRWQAAAHLPAAAAALQR